MSLYGPVLKIHRKSDKLCECFPKPPNVLALSRPNLGQPKTNFRKASNFFYDLMLNLTSSHYTSNERALNKLSLDVCIMWLWRHKANSQHLEHNFRKAFCLLTSFIIACWIWPVTTQQMSIKYPLVWYTHYVVMTSQNHFRTLLWMHDAFNLWLRYIKWIVIQ